jgi:hypothetical protein
MRCALVLLVMASIGCGTESPTKPLEISFTINSGDYVRYQGVSNVLVFEHERISEASFRQLTVISDENEEVMFALFVEAERRQHAALERLKEALSPGNALGTTFDAPTFAIGDGLVVFIDPDRRLNGHTIIVTVL